MRHNPNSLWLRNGVLSGILGIALLPLWSAAAPPLPNNATNYTEATQSNEEAYLGETHLREEASPKGEAKSHETTKRQDASFGRLFTTSAQRHALDEARHNGGYARSHISGVDENSNREAGAVPLIKLSGVLMRADGQHQIWINGVSQTNQTNHNKRIIVGSILQSASVKVPLRGSHSEAILKPGQVWIPTKRRMEEAYQLPVAKPIVAEPLSKPDAKNPPQPTLSSSVSSSFQASSTNTREVNSSVQASTK